MTVSSVDQNAASVSFVETAAALPELASAPSMAGGTEVKNVLPLFAAAKTDGLPELASAPSMAGGTEVKNALPLFAAAKTDGLPELASAPSMAGATPQLAKTLILFAAAKSV